MTDNDRLIRNFTYIQVEILKGSSNVGFLVMLLSLPVYGWSLCFSHEIFLPPAFVISFLSPRLLNYLQKSYASQDNETVEEKQL